MNAHQRPTNVVYLDSLRQPASPLPGEGGEQPARSPGRFPLFLALSLALHAAAAAFIAKAFGDPWAPLMPPKPLEVALVEASSLSAVPAQAGAPAGGKPPTPGSQGKQAPFKPFRKKSEPGSVKPPVQLKAPQAPAPGSAPEPAPSLVPQEKPGPDLAEAGTLFPVPQEKPGLWVEKLALSPSPGVQASSLAAPSFAAAYLHNPSPEYPLSARQAGQEGLVLLRVLVDRQGQPEQVRLEQGSGFAVLDRAALQAVQRWTFVPARRGAEPVKAWIEVPLRFRLKP